MAKQPQTPESFQDLVFPARGIDLTQDYMGQIQGTTPVGQNVRLYEPGSLRARGGSRSGLSKYLADQHLTAGHPIQHLNYVVDPTTLSLLANDGNDGEVLDPSTSNKKRRMPSYTQRRVRKGGSGKQPNVKLPPKDLVITANDQNKNQGDTFTFTGTEFSVSGLEGADSISFVTLASDGAAAGAAAGFYPITAAKPITLTNASGTAYDISFVDGSFFVSDADTFPLPLPKTYGSGTPVPPGWDYVVSYTGSFNDTVANGVIGTRYSVHVTRSYSLPDGGHQDQADMNPLLQSNNNGPGWNSGAACLVKLAGESDQWPGPYGAFN